MGKHGTPVKKDKLQKIFAELDQTAKDLGVADDKRERRAEDHAAAASREADAPSTKPIKIAPFDEGLAMVGLDKDLDAGKPIAPRKAYGAALVALGAADKRIVGLDADVKNSTHAEWFAKKFPEPVPRVQDRRAEHVLRRRRPGRRGEDPVLLDVRQVRRSAATTRSRWRSSAARTSRSPAPTPASRSPPTGPARCRCPDVAFFRSFCHVKNYNGQPAVRYFFPADAVSCYSITELMANLDGACYQRTLRADTKRLYKPDDTFEVGGFKVLREGKDVVLRRRRLHGPRVPEGRRRAGQVRQEGRRHRRLLAAAEDRRASSTSPPAAAGRIVTVEDNYTGGLDAEIATAIANTGDDDHAEEPVRHARSPSPAASRRTCWITWTWARRRSPGAAMTE